MKKLETSLLLESKDVSNTTINGVSHPSECFVGDSSSGITSVVYRQVQQQLGDIARSEHLVNRRKVAWGLVVAEVRSENALARAFSPKELARST